MNMAISQNINGCQKADVTVVVGRFYVALYRFALCLTASNSDSANLVQQTFVRFSQRPLQIQDYSKIKCWLFAALHRYYVMEICSRSDCPHPRVADRHSQVEIGEGQSASQVNPKN